MKLFISTVLILIGIDAFAASNPCEQSEQQGLMLIAQSISSQIVGTPVYTDDFMTRIFLTTKSGETVLSVGGILHHDKRLISIHGLLECNTQTGEYEFAGAGTSGQ